MQTSRPLVSIVIPVFNESGGLDSLHEQLLEYFTKNKQADFEIVYVNDGSTDATVDVLKQISRKDELVHVISLTRNFGKEIATTAGIQAATGDAIITMDGDGQHPVSLLSKLIVQWQEGHKVVIGLRTSNNGEGAIKNYGSKLFYKIINMFADVKMVPNATDFRLIDRDVQKAFSKMTERNRITRGLIDWLGYDRVYVPFTAERRMHGQAGYSFTRLVKLAVDSMVSMSISPLYIAVYLGMLVLPISALLAIFMAIDNVFGDPFNLHLTGGAFVMVLMLFLIGVILLSQGIIGIYLARIHSETQNRPLYLIDQNNSTQLPVNAK